jgi:hypothetical protein
MAGFTKYFEDLILNTLHDGAGSANITAADTYVALFTTTPTDAAAGTEPADGGYARVLLTATTLTITGGGAGGTPSVASNPAARDFPHGAAGGNWVVTHIGLFDSSAGGNFKGWGPLLVPKTIGQNETLQFAIGAITISLS